MPTRCRRELGVWRYISVDRVTTVELFRQNFQTNTVKQLFLLLYYKVTILLSITVTVVRITTIIYMCKNYQDELKTLLYFK